MKLIIPTDITRQMYSIVYDTELATGLTLFGEKEGQDFIVTAVAGPGPDAIHQELHYSGNKEYATVVFNYLRQDNPNLKHIGELYVHLFERQCLSRGELDAVEEALKEHNEFIAGVILRNHRWDFKVFPTYFSRSQPEGTNMEAVFDEQMPYRNLPRRSARFRRR